MDRLIKILEGRPTDGNAIVNFCLGRPKFVRYSELKRVGHIDEIFGDGMCLLLYDSKEVGHFVSLIKTGENAVELFDPYGDYTDDFIGDKRVRWLTKLLAESDYDVVMNDRPLQSESRSIATCGRHCAARLRMWMERKTSLDDYCSLMEKNKGEDPDKLVTMLTFFM